MYYAKESTTETAMHRNKKIAGFTIIEIAVALTVLSILLLAAGMLLITMMNTYAKVTSTTTTLTEARHCLEVIAQEMREGIGAPFVALPAIVDPNDPRTPETNDAIMIISPRQLQAPTVPSTVDHTYTTFVYDTDFTPIPQSIILYYLNTTPEGETRLMKLQLYYDEDLGVNMADPPASPNPPPFTPQTPVNLLNPNIGLIDANNAVIIIDKATGAIGGAGGTPPRIPPRVIMNQTESFDIVDTGGDPIRIRVSCQVIDRFNRTATTRLDADIEPRN